jgi:small subunit ribosomal protein S7e
MASYTSKVQRTANAPAGPADEIEKTVAQAILDLETNVPELKSELQQLAISAAKEVDVKGGKKAIVVSVLSQPAKTSSPPSSLPITNITSSFG